MSETQPGVDDVTPLSDQPGGDAEEYDQDSEPSLNAPEEGRPDGLEALSGDDSEGSDDSDSTGGDGTPS
ncbi:MAG: hypothetical protein ACJ714_04330 [Ornithinibacter sp.]